MDKNIRLEKILTLLANSPGLRVPQIAKAIDFSSATIERDLKELKDSHRVEFRGSAKAGGYHCLPTQSEEDPRAEHRKCVEDIGQHIFDETIPSETRRKIEWEYFRNIKKFARDNDLIFDFYRATEALLSGDKQKFNQTIADLDKLADTDLNEPITEELAKAMDAAWYATQFKYLMQDYPYRDKEYPLLCELEEKSRPYLKEYPEVFAAFIQAIQKNLEGESAELFHMIQHLTVEFETITSQTANYVVSSLYSARAVAGQNTDRKGQLEVFNDIYDKQEADPPASSKEFFGSYYAANPKELEKLGWKNARSLQEAYRRWSSDSRTRQPNPLAIRYPSTFGDIEWDFNKKDS